MPHVYAADQALRHTRPDSRTVTEDFVRMETSKEGYLGSNCFEAA
jgi:hypothetical protein